MRYLSAIQVIALALAASAAFAQSSIKEARDANRAVHEGDVTGYAYHGVSVATYGSGIGGATWGIGSGVVGNKPGDTEGNGVIGVRFGGGAGDGVAGEKQGTGAGNGVRGTNSSLNKGAAGQFLRSNGEGDGVEAIREGAGPGSAITGVRKAGEEVVSTGVLGYYDPKTQASYGVFAAAPAGIVKLAGRFDGDVQINGGFGVNGAKPIGKPRITGSRGKNQAMKSLLQQLAAYGLIEDATTE